MKTVRINQLPAETSVSSQALVPIWDGNQTWQATITQIAPVRSFMGRPGDIVLTTLDVTNGLGYTPASLVSPAFTGTPTAPTPTYGDRSTLVATTQFATDSSIINALIFG